PRPQVSIRSSSMAEGPIMHGGGKICWATILRPSLLVTRVCGTHLAQAVMQIMHNYAGRAVGRLVDPTHSVSPRRSARRLISRIFGRGGEIRLGRIRGRGV